MDYRVGLWEIVNEYVRSCRGNPDKYVYGNTPRQLRVAELERHIKRALIAARAEAIEEAAVRSLTKQRDDLLAALERIATNIENNEKARHKNIMIDDLLLAIAKQAIAKARR